MLGYLPDKSDRELYDFVDVGKDDLDFVRLGNVVSMN